MARYATAKRQLLAHTSLQDKDIRTHALASLVAGTVATTICTPADVLKSRIQSTSGKSGSSITKIIAKGLKEEGPRFLMKGWTPAWLRLA
jgi:solute carrier family 25 (mitochondrial dicarboxylate transporter), member 10